MLDFPTPKTMAKALRSALSDHGHALTHGQCLDIVAKQFGYADWNVLSALGGSLEQSVSLDLPDGWFTSGRLQSRYFRIGLDPDMDGSVVIKAISDTEIPDEAFGGLMQSISARNYRGTRLRLSAELRSRQAGLGTIWLRVDPADGGRYLAFDNMTTRAENGAVTGNTDWVERHVVLDVPDEAGSIHFGFFLQEQGAVWARNFRLQTVEQAVPVTGGGRDLPEHPSNLGFLPDGKRNPK